MVPTKKKPNRGDNRRVPCSHIADLPSEVLASIVEHVTWDSLIRLQRVSKQFFLLASAELYAFLDFRLTTPGSRDNDTPASRVFSALQSIITSDYDYAQHIRVFRMSVSPENPANSLTITQFLWGTDMEPVKALNTTLLLVLRKALAMEAFEWNVPVELSEHVYQALQCIPTLSHLEIALGGGQSNLSLARSPFPPTALGGATASTTQPSSTTTILSTASNYTNISGNSTGALKRGQSTATYNYWGTRRDISKFSKLQKLALNDISDLECLDSIASCINASSSHLKTLTLSLSRTLALKARKSQSTPANTDNPIDPNDLDNSESDNENAGPQAEAQTAQAISGPDRSKAKKAQECVLSVIFGLQNFANEGKNVEKILKPRKNRSSITQGHNLSKPSILTANPPSNPANDDLMEVDMDHPDASPDDFDNDDDGEEEEEGREREESAVNTRNDVDRDADDATSSLTPVSLPARDKGKEAETPAIVDASHPSPSGPPKTDDELIQDYVRATHGLQLEELTLNLIPLKASIITRALDLSVLRRITLVDVGKQDAFWSLLHRLCASDSIQGIGFDTIHTDDISYAFIDFLRRTSHSAKEIILHKRRNGDPKPDASKGPVKLMDILEAGLSKHYKTLTHLMLKNDSDDSWDFDDLTFRALTCVGTRLVELAISVKRKAMHILFHHVSRFSALRVLYFFGLRTGGASSALSPLDIEPVSFLCDAIAATPDRNIRYVAIGDRYATIETPAETQKRVQALVDRLANDNVRRGQMLMKDLTVLGLAARAEELIPNHQNEGSYWAGSNVELGKLRAGEALVRWSHRFWDIEDVKVFKKVKQTDRYFESNLR